VPSLDRNLSVLFLVNIVAALYWNMTGIFVPLYIRSLGASVFQVSLVLFVGGLVSAATMLPSGFLADRYGRRKLIVLSVATMSVSPLLYSMAKTWQETILYTVINTVAFSLFTPARMTMIADSVKPTVLATSYGLMNLAWPIGGIVGPMLGGFIADNYGWTSLFYSFSITTFACTLASLCLRESMRKPVDKEEKGISSLLNRDVAVTLALLFFIHIAGNTAGGILQTVFPFHLTENFNKSMTEAGLFFSFGFGMATLIAQLPSGLLADRAGRRKTMAYSVFLIPLLALLFLFTNDYATTLLIYMMISGLWSATWPASAAYLMDDSSSASIKGVLIGVRLTAVRLGFTIGPLIGGYLWDAFDVATSFYATAAFYALSMFLILLLKE